MWIRQLAKKRLSRCGGMCSQNRRRGHFQGARTGPPSVWGLEEQPPSRLLLGNQEEKILKIQVSKHVLVFPQFWTVTTRAFAIYLSTRRSTQWPHVPTVWLLMSDAQRIFQTEVDLRIRMNLSVPNRQYGAWISHILYIANTMLTSRTLSFYTLMREDTFGESHFP